MGGGLEREVEVARSKEPPLQIQAYLSKRL